MNKSHVWYIFLIAVTSSYLPGTNSKSYSEKSEIKLYLNNLDSSITQLPFNYNYLNFCKPSKSDAKKFHSSDDYTTASAYRLAMHQTTHCEHLCEVINSNEDMIQFEWMIDNRYRANWIIDDLPSGYRVSVPESQTSLIFYQSGVPIGFKSNGKRYIYNHHHIILKVYQTPKDSWKLAGFLVEPYSIQTTSESICEKYNWVEILANGKNYSEKIVDAEYDLELVHELRSDVGYQKIEKNIEFTYSVTYEITNTKWTSRWEAYLNKPKSEIHWLSILNSFGMVIFLSVMVAHLFRKTLDRDIDYYNERVDADEVENGWKQLRGDVFRPPDYSYFFSVFIGNGLQVVFMLVSGLFFAWLGILRLDHTNELVVLTIFLFSFMGLIGGYSSSRLYKLFNGYNWQLNSLTVSTFFPGLCFIIFFIINFLIWEEESSGAVDFASLLELAFIWLGTSLPLTYIGSFIGYRKPLLTFPCEVSKIPKPLSYDANKKIVYLVSGLAGSLPFGCMFIELNYIMKSFWHHSLVYYLFGFLFLSVIILLITSAEVSILMSYILLCREDYRWWWASFVVPAGSGCYLFLYSIGYYFYQLDIERFSSSVLYFGYMFIASVAYSFITGTVGFVSTFIFLKRIFALIKSD